MALLIELGLILLFSIIGGVLAVRFKQPTVLGLILVGAIVGPNALSFVHDESLIENSIEIGAVLLLFTLGIEFSLQKILNLGIRAVIISAVKIGLVFLISYYSAYLLGFPQIASVFIGVILSITSTVIVIKILEQKGYANSPELPLLITILIIEDIFAVFSLTFFSGLNESRELSKTVLFIELGVALLLLIVTYLIIQRVFKFVVKWLAKYSTEETTTFLSLGLCGIMSYIALYLGLSPSVGAFLAGNIVASLPNSKTFEKAIHPFLLTFTSLFFFSIGTNVNFNSVIASGTLILAIFAINVIAKFITVGFGTYVFGNFDGKQAIFAGIAMVSVGEFSLLIAKESNALGLGIDLVSITASVIFLSSIAMNVLLTYNVQIYNLVSNMMPKRVREDMELFSKYFSGISIGMMKDKIASKEIKFEWKTIARNIFIVIFAAYGIWVFFDELSSLLFGFFRNQFIINIIFIIAAIAFFFPIVQIFKNLEELFMNLLKIFKRLYPKEDKKDKKIFRNFILLGLAFVILLLVPFFSVVFKIRYINLLVFLFLGISIWYILRSTTLIESLAKKKAITESEVREDYIVQLKDDAIVPNERLKRKRK